DRQRKGGQQHERAHNDVEARREQQDLEPVALRVVMRLLAQAIDEALEFFARHACFLKTRCCGKMTLEYSGFRRREAGAKVVGTSGKKHSCPVMWPISQTWRRRGDSAPRLKKRRGRYLVDMSTIAPATTMPAPSRRIGVIACCASPSTPKWSISSDEVICPATMMASIAAAPSFGTTTSDENTKKAPSTPPIHPHHGTSATAAAVGQGERSAI